MSALVWDSLVTSSAISKMWCAVGVSYTPLKSCVMSSKKKSNVIDHRCNHFDWRGLANGHPKVFVFLILHDGHIHNVSIICINVSKHARHNFGIKMLHLQVYKHVRVWFTFYLWQFCSIHSNHIHSSGSPFLLGFLSFFAEQ